MWISHDAKRVCLIPNVSGVGGMVSFRDKLINGLTERGIGITFDLTDMPYAAILVIGGSRDLPGLWRAKKRGVRIVQRLDGINWIHRRRRTGWRHYVRAEYGNIILSVIRSRLADKIVYQSEFSQRWWEQIYGTLSIPRQVVYNGVDLQRYSPIGEGKIPEDYIRILLVEGAIAGGYEWGLETAIKMVECVNTVHRLPIELMVVGRVSESMQRELKEKVEFQVNFTGQLPADKIPEMDRSAHLLYAADVNAACPNSVIEALACGLPVTAFDTGALSELIPRDAGILVPYGGNPWKLDPPDIDALVEAVNKIINNQVGFRAAARKRAEEAFGLDHMVEGYLDALNI
jgi:glycosyltransferase involved in cell wall biosynthesis